MAIFRFQSISNEIHEVYFWSEPCFMTLTFNSFDIFHGKRFTFVTNEEIVFPVQNEKSNL
jgi:hypothetical protein